MITLNQVTKSFGSTKAIDSLTLAINKGEVLGLLGPNGAGKTTTMRLISGFLYPDAGEINVNGISVTRNPSLAQAQIGYLPENNPLYSEMLVSEFLEASAKLKQVDTIRLKKLLNFIIPALGLQAVYNKSINQLSKGYKQRVGIATTLLHSPKVLILDEPTEGLDPNQRSEMRQLLKNLATEHTVILSTHVMQEVSAVCDRIVIINNGKIVADGSQAELVQSDAQLPQITVELEGQKLVSTLKKSNTFSVISSEKTGINRSEFVLQATQAKTPIQPKLAQLANKNKWTIWQLQSQQQDLESVFEQVTTNS